MLHFGPQKALSFANGLSGSGYHLSLLHMLYNVKCKQLLFFESSLIQFVLNIRNMFNSY
jgi:hypothetical protein